MEGLGKITHDMGSTGITVGVLALVAGAIAIFAPELLEMGFDYMREGLAGFFTPFG